MSEIINAHRAIYGVEQPINKSMALETAIRTGQPTDIKINNYQDRLTEEKLNKHIEKEDARKPLLSETKYMDPENIIPTSRRKVRIKKKPEEDDNTQIGY